jgi:hypothetical protein
MDQKHADKAPENCIDEEFKTKATPHDLEKTTKNKCCS